MGVRLYDAGLGRFLSTDSLPGGGDPINKVDLDGRWSWWKTWAYSWGKVKIHAWSFLDWWGYHVGGSLYVYFSHYWTGQIAAHLSTWWDRVGVVLGVVSAMTANKYIMAAAALLWLYGWWVQDVADYANKHGQCLRVKAAEG